MTLATYRAKRNFRKTPEPGARRARGNRQTIFVIQEHHASRLHYDFRLEADGVLKSWAVPKEPTLDPSIKRLAVHVEDHPLDYARFHGRIPKGEYGAGTVSIWDHGTYENVMAGKPVPLTVSESIEAGHVEVDLHGKKLHGRFAMVRMNGRGKDNWLLIKMKDEFAQKEAAAGPEPKVGGAARPARQAPKKKKSSNSRNAPKEETAKVAFSHVDKIMFPESKITKGEVLKYYLRVAPLLLPYLRDRPVTLERFPEGIGDKGQPHFWQKDTPDYYPDWIPRIKLSTEAGKRIQYTLVNDANTLLYLVNQGALTFHVWFSRVEDLDRPDFVLFDLDLSKASFAAAVEIARELHKILTREKVASFIKTSGKTGLHIMAPWKEKGGYDEARAWAETIADRVVHALPEVATTERSKANRGRRVYVDVMQNARGKHVVPAYVLRAVPGAPVSTPLAWNELSTDLDPSAFNLKSIFRRLARQKSDPIAALLNSSAPAKQAKTSKRRSGRRP